MSAMRQAQRRSRTMSAVFVPEEAGDCKITMTFLPNDKLKVEQRGEECGFGHNVRADGTFRKISDRKPKFDDALMRMLNTMNDVDRIPLNTQLSTFNCC
jgi:hypothetical protein